MSQNKNILPPQWADKLLEWYCSEQYLDEIQGDLHEWFSRRIQTQGIKKARILYPLDVIRFARTYRLKSYDEFYKNSNNATMFKNYVTTSWRSLKKNKVFSIINILGLTIGMSAFLLISLYVRHEMSYDNFHEKGSNLYRLQQNRYNKGELTTQWAAGCAGIGPDLKQNFPEVKRFVKMTPSNAVLQYENKIFKEENAYYASQYFFELFSFPLIDGVDSLVLKEPYKAVVSESLAKKYFGDENPVGKTLRQNGARDFEVTGVYKDIPANSHMKVDILFSFETYVDIQGEGAITQWQWDGFLTYLLLEDGTDYKSFEAKLPGFVEKKVGEDLAQYNAGQEFLLQPIGDIHLTSNYIMEFQPNGDKDTTRFLLIIAIFIVLIAWVNYVNLATAKSMDRSREVGIRKVMGSLRGQLINQFLVESLILNAFALLLALVIVNLALPYFNMLSGRDLVFNIADPVIWQAIGVLVLIGGMLSGIYPAIVMSGFKPVTVLKGKLSSSKSGNFLRKGLVVFQFLASLVLMIGTFTVFQQLNYMRSESLGVNIEKTLVIRGPNVTDSLYNSKFNTFKQTLTDYSDVVDISASTAVPGSSPGWNAGGVRLVEEDDTQSNQYRVIGGDADFVSLYGLEVLEGRAFEEERSNEEENLLINESASELFGFKTYEEALQRDVFFWGDTFKIVGVLKDYHQESLKKSFEPLLFRFIPNTTGFYSVRINTSKMPRTIDTIEKEWQTTFPGNPFDFFFLDDHYNNQYKAETQFGSVFGLFAALAIFIACLGLFGLASFVTSQRTKEIGVRKVLGATLSNVLVLLSKDFTLLILVSFVFAIPLAWYIMSQWLEGFAYQIGLSWWLFAIPAIVLLSVALITITFQTMKAALCNPVDSLRHE